VQGNHPEMATRYFEKPYYALTEGHLELKNFPVAHKPESPEPDTWFEFAKDWLHRHSKFYNFAGVMIKSSQLTHLRSVLVRLGLMDSPDASQSKGWFEESVFSEEYVPKWDEAWAITRALIHELRQEARSRGAGFAVVIVTDDAQLSAIDGVEVDLAKPNRLLTEFLDQEAIPYLDLYPVLLTFQTETGIPVHLTNDVHWTAEGHRQAGEQVCAWLHETVPFSP
jgi:hypothetical protein